MSRLIAQHRLRAQETPFDRAPDVRPLMHIIADLDHVRSEDAEAMARVLALDEIPVLSVCSRRGGEPMGLCDLRVASQPSADVTMPTGTVTPAVALDLVRLLLVNRGLFYLRGGTTVNEGFYYLYRSKSVFRGYQPAWSAAVFGTAALGKQVMEQLSSLGTRLEFLCRAADRGAHASLQRANNDTQDNILYHLAYFVMLATGVFDDLAWTLTYLYQLPLRRRNHVVLKLEQGKSSSLFLDALTAVAPHVATRIGDPKVQGLLRVFYPVRDRLQHRQFLQGLLYVGGPWGVPKILFDFPEDAIQSIRDVSTDGRGTDWGLGSAGDTQIDPYVFLMRGFTAIAAIHEEIIGAVDWLEMVGPTGDPIREKVSDSLARYYRSLAAFLKWPAEPLYF